MKSKNEIKEAKSLRWLATQFPFTENAKDDIDKMTNCINVYCTAGANKIEELAKMVDELREENYQLKIKLYGDEVNNDKL